MTKLYLFLIIQVLFIFTEAFESTDPEFVKNATECAKVNNNIDISMFEGGKKLDRKMFEQHDYRCMAKCVGAKLTIWDNEGEVDPEHVFRFFHFEDNNFKNKIRKCIDDNKQEDSCDKAYARFICVLDIIKGDR